MTMLRVPEKIIGGRHTEDQAAEAIKKLGHGKIMLVTGPHVGQGELFARYKSAIEAVGVECVVFDRINGEPTDSMIRSGAEVYKSTSCRAVMGIGGGSPLDAAKLIAAYVRMGEDLFAGKDLPDSIGDIAALPTTTGTGSEATKFACVTLEADGVKLLVKGDAMIPRIAVLDYDASLGMPSSVKAATAFDALTHAIEAYLSRRATPVTDDLAVSAVRRIYTSLAASIDNPADAAASRNLAVAAFEAGICINNSSVTVVHGMSRPIGALFHISHGLSNAMLLTTCLRDLATVAADRLAELGRAAGIITENEDASVMIDRIDALRRRCDIPSLSRSGIDADRFEASLAKMASDALASGSPANAPKDYTAADLIALYRKAWSAQ